MEDKPPREEHLPWEERWKKLSPTSPPPILKHRFLASVSAQSLGSPTRKDPDQSISRAAALAAAAIILIALFIGFPRQLGNPSDPGNTLAQANPLGTPSKQVNSHGDSEVSGKRVILEQEALAIEFSEDGQAVQKTRVRAVDQIEFNDPDSREKLRISIPREWVISSQVTTM